MSRVRERAEKFLRYEYQGSREARERIGSNIIRALVEENERLERALRHLKYRNHDASVGCDGCVEVYDALSSGREGGEGT